MVTKIQVQIWVFPKIGVPQNGWFIRENPIKMDDLGGTPIFGNTHMDVYACLWVVSSYPPQSVKVRISQKKV